MLKPSAQVTKGGACRNFAYYSMLIILSWRPKGRAMAQWFSLNMPLISSPPQSFFSIKYRRYGLLLVSFIEPVALLGGNTAFLSPPLVSRPKCRIKKTEVESSRTSLASRTHFEVLGLGLEGQVLGLGLEASSPRKLACPRLEDSTIF